MKRGKKAKVSVKKEFPLFPYKFELYMLALFQRAVKKSDPH